jgi:hypothetical protein
MKQTLMLATLSGLLAISCSHKEKPKEYQVMNDTETETAKVSDVDYANRTITMATKEGPVTVVAGEEIRNLDQIKKGDTVKAEYKSALVYSIDKSGNMNAPKLSSDTWRAKPGDQPGAGVNTQVTASVIVTDINRNEPSVTLKNEAGEKETFKVAHPERLDDLDVGDTVNIKYSQAMAVKVEKTNSATY